MKKKIKDLTIKEAKVICDKHYSCVTCPLNFSKKAVCVPCYLDNLVFNKYVTEQQLNNEVEIDESDND